MKKIYLSKAKTQIARHTTIRDINKRIVLNYVRARPEISRAEIARETSLQRSTVSAIVDDLLNDDLIEELGPGSSTGGRKPTLLKLKSGVPCAIGVDVTPRETNIVLADLTGEMLQESSFPTSSDIGYMNEQILSRVSCLTKENADHELEVGISIPGIADQVTQRILYIPYFQWTNWDIAEQIKKKTGLPVLVDNDANAVALAELWFGEPEIRKTRNFILVMIAEGIGTGIIIDGQIYRGENGAAGEFGHMFVAANAAVDCSCGRRDCWEAHASEKAILERYRSYSGGEKSALDIFHLIGLAQNGEKRAIAALKETATFIGLGISNLVMGFSPQTVVVAGPIVAVWDLIKDEIMLLEKRSIRQELANPQIIPSTLGPRPTSIGAVSLVLSRKFVVASVF